MTMVMMTTMAMAMTTGRGSGGGGGGGDAGGLFILKGVENMFFDVSPEMVWFFDTR